jgi:hypothetical protein
MAPIRGMARPSDVRLAPQCRMKDKVDLAKEICHDIRGGTAHPSSALDQFVDCHISIMQRGAQLKI